MSIKTRFGIAGLTILVSLIAILCIGALSSRLSQPTQGMTDPQTGDGTGKSSKVTPLVLRDEQGSYPLGLHLEILEDPSGKLAIEDVSSPAYEDKFFPSQVPVPNFGYTNSVYWVRFDLDNQTQHMDDWLLDIGYVYIQYVDLYSPSPDSSGFKVKQTGALRPVSTRDILNPHILFNLPLPAQSQHTYYLRFQSAGSMTLPLTLWSKDAFWVQAQPNYMQEWLFIGAFLALLLYHLFLYSSLRDTRYLLFVLMLAALLFHYSTYTGYLQVYVFPWLYRVEPLGIWSTALAYASIVLFADAFWELPTRHPKTHWMYIGLLVGWAAIIILAPYISYHRAISLVIPYALVSTLVVAWIPWLSSWKKSFTLSRYFVIAWLGMLIGLLLRNLVRLTFVPSTPITEGLYQWGILIMAVGWSMALADRIHQLITETDRVNQDLQQSQHELAQILDGVPLGIAVYGQDKKPKYLNKRAVEIFNNPQRGIRPGLQSGRTLAESIEYLSLHVAGTSVKYPVDKLPITSALQGQPAHVDDLVADLVDKNVPVEMWASPITNQAGNVISAVAAYQDITLRKQEEAELEKHRKHLETMVQERTRELQMHLEWLEAVNLVNQTVASTNDFSQMYEKIVEIASQIFHALDAYIAELDASGKQLKILAHSCHKGDCSSLIGSFTTLPNGIPSGKDVDPGEPAFIIRDQIGIFDNPFGEHIRTSALQSMIIIPLRLREQVLGYLGWEMLETVNNISREENHILHILSTDVAQIIQNAHFLEQSRLLIAVEERNRLARDLHDSVAQAFFGIRLYANAIQMARQNNRLDDLLNHIKEMNKLAQQGQADMRLLIFQLRPPILDEGGLPVALQNRLNAVESRAGFKIQFEASETINLTPEQELELYQIAQEILNNIIKHAQANEVKVHMTDEDGCFQMMIADNGVGFDVENASQFGGQGLRNLRERTKKIGAACNITSAPGQGTKIVVEMEH